MKKTVAKLVISLVIIPFVARAIQKSLFSQIEKRM